MSKQISAIISDPHWGVRGNSVPYRNNLVKFFDTVFFPTLVERGIKKIINCGDLFDDRKKTDTATIKSCREHYYEKLVQYGITEDLIIGNHDTYMRQSNDLNAPTAILKDYINSGHLNVFHEPTEVGDCLYIPWINKHNHDETMQAIANTTKRYCFGHLELVGFQWFRGKVSTKGMDSAPFEKFQLTGSGHYHCRNQQRQIIYLGSPTQHTWQDCGDARGFHIFDHESGDLEFIKNPHNIYTILTYNNEKITEQQIEQCKGRFVRVFYSEVNKESELEKFKQAIEQVAHEVRTIRSQSAVSAPELGALDSHDIEVEDTMTIIKNATEDDSELQQEMFDLLQRAMVVMR